MSSNSDLLRKEERNPTLGPSATIKQASAEQPRDRHRVTWCEENTAAIQAYNEHIGKYGTFSESVRKF